MPALNDHKAYDEAKEGGSTSGLTQPPWWDSSWQYFKDTILPVAGSSLDLAHHQVSAETDWLGTFAVISQINPQNAQHANYCPLVTH